MKHPFAEAAFWFLWQSGEFLLGVLTAVLAFALWRVFA